MKIDVIDMDDPVVAQDAESIVQGFTNRVIKMYPMSNGIAKMADDVGPNL
jgi:hypothetical protein